MKAEYKEQIKDAINAFGLEYSYNKDIGQAIDMASDFLDTEKQLDIFTLFLAEFTTGKETVEVQRVKDPQSDAIEWVSKTVIY